MKHPKDINLFFLYILTAIITYVVINIGAQHIRDGYFLASSVMNRKLHYLKQLNENFDIYFMGSSYIFRHVQPNIVDAVLINNGLNLKSYSFSEGGSFAFETEHYINQIKTFDKEKKPKFIIIDLYSADKDNVIKIQKENFLIPRIIEYHDIYTTWLNIKCIFMSSVFNLETFISSYDHILHYVYNFSHIGMGKLVFKEDLLSDSRKFFREKTPLMISGKGYFPELSGKKAKSDKFNEKEYLQILEGYKQQYRSGSREKKKIFTKVDYYFREQQYKNLRKNGLEVIYMIPSRPYDTYKDIQDICEQKDFPPCIYMNDPFKYADLFDVENRWDKGHLNDRGSQLFSKYFAQELVSTMKTLENKK